MTCPSSWRRRTRVSAKAIKPSRGSTRRRTRSIRACSLYPSTRTSIRSTLIPVSPTCFRWEGEGLAPGLTAVFHVDDKAVELTVVQPGKPEVVMKRTPGGPKAG